jgi:hypothetical protein
VFKNGLWLLLLCASGASASVPSFAAAADLPLCSLDPAPSEKGFDPKRLVRAAHVVVVARADSSSRLVLEPGGRLFPVVHFSVIETIDAGSMNLPSDLRIPGGLTSRSEFNQDPVPYRWVRPSGQRGSCFSSEYQQGGEFLLLLRGPSADSLSPYWAPLAPTNEQVQGRDDPWVTWVRRARH